MSIFLDSMKRPDDMARITTPELAKAFLDEVIPAVQAQVGDKKVLLACPAAWIPPSWRRCW